MSHRPVFRLISVLILLSWLVGAILVAPSLTWAQDNATNQDSSATKTDQEAPASPDAAPPLPESPPALDPVILETPVDDTFLRQIWESRATAIQQMALEVSSSVEQLLNANVLGTRLASANQELSRLMRLYQVSRAYPAHQEDILRQMKGLRVKIVQDLDALNIQKSLLTQRQEEAAALKKDMSGLVFSEDSDPQSKRDLERASAVLELTDQKVSLVLEPGQNLLKNLDAAIAQLENALPQTWRNYYLTSLTASGQGYGLAANLDLIFKWAHSTTSMALFIYPQSGADWLGALVKFLVTMLIAAVLGLAIQRSIARSRLKNKEELAKVFLRPWHWLIFGFALVIGSQNSLGGNYLALKLPGVLALVWGLGSLSWRLRVAARPDLKGVGSPLARFFPPAAVGAIFLFLDCPSGPMSVGWALVLIIFLIWRYKSRQTQVWPIIEKLSFGSSAYFSLASLLTAIFGYPRLAILIFLLLFTLVNILILASALISLGSTLSENRFEEAIHPIKRAIATSLVIPLAFILSLACAIPWLWAAPGLEHLLRNVLTSGYTIGEASFNLTKILFIVFLFFLFRFIRAFGLTSLETLAKSFAGVDSGVIPSLKALFSYLIWAIFGIIALALLGVNFTSLAVVAGGLSVGVGLGLQSIFGNLVSGIILMLGQTIRVGDLVEVGGVTGTVKSVHIRSTVLETAEKSVVYVPNSSVMSGQFVNWTRNNRLARRKITVQACYGVDIALAIKLLNEAALANEKVLSNDPPTVLFSEFGDNSLVFNLLVTVVIDGGLGVLSDLRQDIEKRFVEQGITLWNPCLEVTLVKPNEDAAHKEPDSPVEVYPDKPDSTIC